jgi:site-specific recombinase XerD
MGIRFDEDRERWVVEFQQGRRRIHRRLPSGCTRAQAKALETKLRREIFDRVDLDRHEGLTLAEAIGRWLLDNHRRNQRQAESEAAQWAPFVAGKMLADAPEVAADAAREWRRPRDVKDGKVPAASTINARLNCLKAVCKHAFRQGWTKENLSARIVVPKPRNEREIYLTKPEVAALAKAMQTKRGAAAVWLLAYCGPRVSELLQHPAVPAGVTRLHFPARTTKTSKARVVPVPAPARRYLSVLPLDEYSYDSFHNEFDRARRAAGMAHVRIHDLRHTCASWLINEGVDLYTVARILGDSLQTAQRYAHLADATLERAMRLLR